MRETLGKMLDLVTGSGAPGMIILDLSVPCVAEAWCRQGEAHSNDLSRGGAGGLLQAIVVVALGSRKVARGASLPPLSLQSWG